MLASASRRQCPDLLRLARARTDVTFYRFCLFSTNTPREGRPQRRVLHVWNNPNCVLGRRGHLERRPLTRLRLAARLVGAGHVVSSSAHRPFHLLRVVAHAVCGDGLTAVGGGDADVGVIHRHVLHQGRVLDHHSTLLHQLVQEFQRGLRSVAHHGHLRRKRRREIEFHVNTLELERAYGMETR